MEYQPINIKGKEYIPVNQRVLKFRELYPNGQIITQILKDDGKRCDVQASIYADGVIVATGHAFEDRTAGMVNKTSYLENAETSAVGRALAFLGIGIVESIASADEVQSALVQQETQNNASKRATRPQISELDKALMRLRDAEQKFCIKNSESIKEKGIQTVKQFHEQVTMQRPDYAETVEVIDQITAEFLEVLQ